MLKSNELVSIVLPTFNSDQFISLTINSILEQSYNNFELLITDDCSTDSTVQIIKKYLDIDSRIKLFVLSANQGVAAARNYSLKNSTGRFVAFCDSDDIWLYNKLQDQINFMISNNYYFTYTYYNLFNNECIIGKQIISPAKINFQKETGLGYVAIYFIYT
jgi:teichuronic acid biosynthesis glycosyltransferase TuaG